MTATIPGLRSALAAMLCLPALLFGACGGLGAREESWVDAELAVPSERVLRQVASLALEKNGYPPGTEAKDAATTVSSGWKVQLQPFKGDGTRHKAHVQYEAKDARTWFVSVRVEKETNEELAKPLELARAKWEAAPDDRESASRILRYMQTVLDDRDFELGPKNVPSAVDDPTAVPSGG